jgi:hypothetical protein
VAEHLRRVVDAAKLDEDYRLRADVMDKLWVFARRALGPNDCVPGAPHALEHDSVRPHRARRLRLGRALRCCQRLRRPSELKQDLRFAR